MNPWKRKEVIGDCALYLGDCLEILPTLPKVDAVITDPPFGIGNFVQTTGNVRGNAVKWNERTPPNLFFDYIKTKSKERIIWGAEHFNCFEGHGALIWDKQQPMPDFSKAEIASKSWGKKTDIFRMIWTNFVNTKTSDHPCERPIRLYEWCIEQLPFKPIDILDPYMGTGSVGVAAAINSIRFIGIELCPKWFELACERIDHAYRQPDFFR